MQIREGNKLIADFMGSCQLIKGQTSMGLVEQAKYHTSWDWLMPVVEKIEQLKGISIYDGFGVEIGTLYCSIKCYERNRQPGLIYQTPYGYSPDSKIHAVWLAVIDFIQWYTAPLNTKE